MRWETGLSRKKIAIFALVLDGSSSQIAIGDDLKIRLDADGVRRLNGGQKFEARGSVLWTTEGEVAVELKSAPHAPTGITDACFIVERVWKSVSYDRMQTALKSLAVDDKALSGYLYHVLLGHDVEAQSLSTARLPAKLSAPGLPELNHSQLAAVRSILSKPLSLIQGPVSFNMVVVAVAAAVADSVGISVSVSVSLVLAGSIAVAIGGSST